MGYKPKDKPWSLKQLKQTYEAALPEIIEERDRQISLLRGHEELPGTWFAEWNEERAEDAYTNAVELRSLFDTDLKLAERWSAYESLKNPTVWRLQRIMHEAHNAILEILHEWHDLTLLSIRIITWNLVADRLILLWDESSGD